MEAYKKAGEAGGPVDDYAQRYAQDWADADSRAWLQAQKEQDLKDLDRRARNAQGETRQTLAALGLVKKGKQ